MTTESSPPDPPPPDDSGNSWAHIRRHSTNILIGGGILATVIGLVVPWLLGAFTEATQDPLIVTASPPSFDNYLFPLTTSPVDAPVEYEQFENWARTHAGVPYLDYELGVTIQGRTTDSIIIENLRPRIVQRQATTTGGWVNAWDACGAGIPERYIEATISSDRVEQRLYVDGEPSDGKRFRVSNSEVESFWLHLTNTSTDTTVFVIDVEYTEAGEAGVVTIASTPDGSPFRLAGGGDPKVLTNSSDPIRLTEDEGARAALVDSHQLC